MTTPITTDEIEALRRAADDMRFVPEGLGALETIAEVLGFVAADARATGQDEARAVELLLRAADLDAGNLREAERVLRRLHYRKVADRIKMLIDDADRAQETETEASNINGLAEERDSS